MKLLCCLILIVAGCATQRVAPVGLVTVGTSSQAVIQEVLPQPLIVIDPADKNHFTVQWPDNSHPENFDWHVQFTTNLAVPFQSLTQTAFDAAGGLHFDMIYPPPFFIRLCGIQTTPPLHE